MLGFLHDKSSVAPCILACRLWFSAPELQWENITKLTSENIAASHKVRYLTQEQGRWSRCLSVTYIKFLQPEIYKGFLDGMKTIINSTISRLHFAPVQVKRYLCSFSFVLLQLGKADGKVEGVIWNICVTTALFCFGTSLTSRCPAHFHPSASGASGAKQLLYIGDQTGG